MPIVHRELTNEQRERHRMLAARVAALPKDTRTRADLLPSYNEEEQRALEHAHECLDKGVLFDFHWQRAEQLQEFQQVQKIISKQVPLFGVLLAACDPSKILDLASAVQ